MFQPEQLFIYFYFFFIFFFFFERGKIIKQWFFLLNASSPCKPRMDITAIVSQYGQILRSKRESAKSSECPVHFEKQQLWSSGVSRENKHLQSNEVNLNTSMDYVHPITPSYMSPIQSPRIYPPDLKPVLEFLSVSINGMCR